MAKHADTITNRPKGKWTGSLPNKYKAPQWTAELKLQWEELFFMLHAELMDDNWSATARVLGITIPTAKAWYEQPPKRVQELETLRRTVKNLIDFLSTSKRGKHRQLAVNMRTKLKRLKLQQAQADDIIVEADGPQGSLLNIISAIAWQSTRQMSMTDLLSTGSLQDLTKRQARRIIAELNLPRVTTGFGKEKETWVSIPHPTDL